MLSCFLFHFLIYFPNLTFLYLSLSIHRLFVILKLLEVSSSFKIYFSFFFTFLFTFLLKVSLLVFAIHCRSYFIFYFIFF